MKPAHAYELENAEGVVVFRTNSTNEALDYFRANPGLKYWFWVKEYPFNKPVWIRCHDENPL